MSETCDSSVTLMALFKLHFIYLRMSWEDYYELWEV